MESKITTKIVFPTRKKQHEHLQMDVLNERNNSQSQNNFYLRLTNIFTSGWTNADDHLLKIEQDYFKIELEYQACWWWFVLVFVELYKTHLLRCACIKSVAVIRSDFTKHQAYQISICRHHICNCNSNTITFTSYNKTTTKQKKKTKFSREFIHQMFWARAVATSRIDDDLYRR